jgi:acyl-CoA reductase-like NAD-dependent aldehyde dehydrogenase
MTVSDTDVRELRHFVGGEWLEAGSSFDDVDPYSGEAVDGANATSYGLSSGIITRDVERGLGLAQRIEAGIVHVDDQPVGDEPQMPFGGAKDSGFGRFGGRAVVDEFTELRRISVRRGSPPFPF